jgi:RNA polymerase sigma-70 factor, ECF subfamily
VPGTRDLPERLEAVLTAIYLIFNEGYASTRGELHIRADLCAEAIRLARIVRALMPPQQTAEVTGLLALMLLHDARRDARLDDAGDIVLLDEQDRGRWDQKQISEALPLVEEALGQSPGPYGLQAAIAAAHCRAARSEDTDWKRILLLYDLLERLQPSPIVTLNRAVAVAMVEGPERALALIDRLAAEGDLEDYHLLHATRADMLRRLGSRQEAVQAYERALARVTSNSERRFLERRISELQR